MAKSSRTQQTPETKKIILKSKRMIDNGEDFKDVMLFIDNNISDAIQREKAKKSVIDYI